VVDVAGNRLDRRKARTRAALVAAARALLASRDPAEVSIQEITDAADVGFGSFYNHFASKQELFDAAVGVVLEEHGAMLDRISVGIEDPAEVFATAVRMTARFPKTQPQIAKIIERTGLDYLANPDGLAPRARRDLEQSAGRFDIGDLDVALACTAGALFGVLHLASTTGAGPRTIDRAADQLAVNLLRMFGLPAEEAIRISQRRLPKAV
jgi:AcrR family transcriptional regulator